MKHLLSLILAFLVSAVAVSQTVSNVVARQVGNTVEITYDLREAATVSIQLSRDGGSTYTYSPKSVTGDVGSVGAGHKKAVWDLLKDAAEWDIKQARFKVTAKVNSGSLSGVFSVSSSKKVRFSRGNLQYRASSGTWRFAEHQWDIVGESNKNISSSYSGWIDLFGWGTGSNPTKTSTSSSDYSSFVDWGRNSISNGGNKSNMWFTLSKDEWVYLFEKRTNASSKYGAAKVNGVTGVVILPDNWLLPTGCSFVAGMTKAQKWDDWSLIRNIYNSSQWDSMERAGAVFLPAAGYRYGTSVYNVGLYGYYWSSTPYDSDYAYGLFFFSYYLYPQYYYYRYVGRSVRLVCSVSASILVLCII